MRNKKKKTYYLVEKIEEPYLVVHAHGNPEYRAVIDQGVESVLVVNDGKEDDFSLENPDSMKMEYYLNRYVGNGYVIYVHYRRSRPIKMCVYKEREEEASYAK